VVDVELSFTIHSLTPRILLTLSGLARIIRPLICFR